ncbi:hypothetical protein IVB03_14125 [Bradyrhizobium sp. 168]|uniref:hypothetical protein n=1 Tax=Bradyrhizobium sp. 168 TaxID=2782639 RepID=UPI001FF8A22B|nr:hypothetical protein [Bradyrhizobium sp. 168]MCK1580689.1 hypothetical protein [Bradyrhizobium sp. 168]
MNESIIRKLVSPTFDPAWKHPSLWERVASNFPQKEFYWPGDRSTESKKKIPAVSDALIVDGNCQSYLSAITGPTAYKIVDWGRNVEFIGRGNQISERGLLLKLLSDERQLEEFSRGNVEAWNPFVLTKRERLFFLYHLAEIDGVILELTKDLGALESGTTVESKDAAVMTSRALIRVLSAAKHSVQPRDVLKFRTACELASTIANEVGEQELASELAVKARAKPPTPVRPSSRRQQLKRSSAPRRANKNADHQTIPRFEQLVDLGFLEKSDEESRDLEVASIRKKWRYRTKPACSNWAMALRSVSEDRSFLWNGFAKACLEMSNVRPFQDEAPIELVAKYLDRAYERVRRQAGYDPLDSVALIGMIMAIDDGVRIEMSDFHRLMLTIKQNSLMPEHAYFASGNDLDQMFILLKPGFAEQVRIKAAEIGEKGSKR